MPVLAIELNITMRFTEETWTEDLSLGASSTFTQLVNEIRNNVSIFMYNFPRRFYKRVIANTRDTPSVLKRAFFSIVIP